MNKNIVMLGIQLVLMIFCDSLIAATYAYDDSNKLQQVTYDNGTVVSYEYDIDGNLTKITPTESASGGDAGDGIDNGNTGGTDDGSDTAEPAKKDDGGGGSLGIFLLFFTAGLITLRSRFKTKLKCK